MRKGYFMCLIRLVLFLVESSALFHVDPFTRLSISETNRAEPCVFFRESAVQPACGDDAHARTVGVRATC